jgi:hypothetical protein
MFAVLTAKLITELKEKGKDTSELEAELNAIFKRCELDKRFNDYKKTF